MKLLKLNKLSISLALALSIVVFVSGFFFTAQKSSVQAQTDTNSVNICIPVLIAEDDPRFSATYASQQQCNQLFEVIGNECTASTDRLSDGDPGDPCCVGGLTECKSGSCSGIGNNTVGTCLGGVGGPSTGPTEEECKELGYDFRCEGCGGFCGNYADGTCNKQALSQCNEVIQFGTCAISTDTVDTYDESQYMCTHYCTNIISREGQDCSASARRPAGTCTYVSPANPNYQEMCPNGNGYTSFGWDGSCFTDVDTSLYATNSYYCECLNSDCSNINFGQGCQDGLQAGNACFQGGTCGVLQVDVDLRPGVSSDGRQQHASQNKLITSGCSVTPVITNPPEEQQPPVVNPPSSPNPSPSTPTSYFCNSTCNTDAQCQTADSNFTCNASEGNRCRLTSNPTSSECQPAVGPMCLSLSLTNISNPNAGATDDPELGDAVNFTCGLVNDADHYIFRVIEPDNNIVDLNATGATSAQYTITKDGMHYAQCQICTGADDSTCHAYEDPFN